MRLVSSSHEVSLDTNVCIRYMNQKSSLLIAKFNAQKPADIAVSTITHAELNFGLEKDQAGKQRRQRVKEFLAPLHKLVFDDAAADEYGSIRADLERAGTLTGPNDLLIASIARAHSLILVTHTQESLIASQD